MEYSDAHRAPRRFSGSPLDEEEIKLLAQIQRLRAVRTTGPVTPLVQSLQDRGVLFCRPALIGDVLSLGYAGCDHQRIDPCTIPSTDAASNLIYFREALASMQALGYSLHKTYTTGRCMLLLGNERHILMARATRGGYSKGSVKEQLARQDILIYNGNVTVFAPDCRPYERLAAHHPHLRLRQAALSGLPTRA